MKKRVLSMLLALVMALSMAVPAFAAEGGAALPEISAQEQQPQVSEGTEPAPGTEGEAPAEEPVPEEPAPVEPEATTEPEATAEPEVTAEPEATTEPEAADEPMEAAEPGPAETIVYVNPLYKGVVTEEELLRLAPASDVAPSATTYYASSIQTAGEYMRSQMKNRVVQISFVVPTSISSSQTVSNQIMDVAVEHTGVPTEGDYLLRQFGAYSGSGFKTTYNGRQCWSMTLYMLYYTTADQEREMDAAVRSLLGQLNLYNKDQYGRIKAIYDYICSHITYDDYHVSDNSYKLQYTAYAGLINGTCVCQGYAALLYRLALESGIDSRVVTNVSHAWNIVKIDGRYYNADSTWDAGRSRYEYFLRGENNFPDHNDLDPPFNTAAWRSEYPVSAQDYVPGATPPVTPAPSPSPGTPAPGEPSTGDGWTKGSDGKSWYYFLDGEAVKNTWVMSARGIWYFMNADGIMVTGVYDCPRVTGYYSEKTHTRDTKTVWPGGLYYFETAADSSAQGRVRGGRHWAEGYGWVVSNSKHDGKYGMVTYTDATGNIGI